MKIYSNKIKCKKCGDIIESKTTHDNIFCNCHSVGIDGGLSYLKRSGNKEDYIELSDFKLEDADIIKTTLKVNTTYN